MGPSCLTMRRINLLASELHCPVGCLAISNRRNRRSLRKVTKHSQQRTEVYCQLVDVIHEFRDESTNWSRSESKEVGRPDLFILFTHGFIRVHVRTSQTANASSRFIVMEFAANDPRLVTQFPVAKTAINHIDVHSLVDRAGESAPLIAIFRRAPQRHRDLHLCDRNLCF